jgi:hypothetical protein
MKFTKVDLDRGKNLITALRRAKFDDLVGVEVLAFAQTFQWAVALVAAMEKEVAPPTPNPVPVSKTTPQENPRANVVSLQDRKKKPRKKKK